MKIRYLLNGTPVNPVRREDIYLEINHDQESVINQPAPHVGINNLYFAREDVKKIMALLNQPPGITEGVPFDIVITERGQSQTINMYLDLMNGFQRSNDGISATVKMLQSLDWLDDKVDAFTYESMYNETGVAPFQVDGINYSSYKHYFDSRCIYVPYIISSVPNWQDAFLALFGMTYVGTELYKVTKNILQWSAPLPGFGLVLGIAQLALEIAFALLLVATLIGLITQLINCLIQPIKYHGAMLMSDLLKITAVKLGLQAQSSIWDAYPYNQIAFLPEKYQPIEIDGSFFTVMLSSIKGFGTSGYTSPAPGIQHGYYNGTGGDFLRLIKSICNGKIIIPNQTNTLQLERRDYFPANTPYQLPNIRQDWNGYNTDELTANILISFATDLNEKNCMDKYTGTRLQATHQQITTVDKSLVCLKGLREINIAAARGINKTQLTFIEKAIESTEIIWNAIITAYSAAIVFAILLLDAIIIVINIFIGIWNLLLKVLAMITDVINVIIDAINTLPGIDIDNIPNWTESLELDYITPIYPGQIQGFDHIDFTGRINCLLLENDMLNVPKLLLVDTSRTEFTNQRIAYLHPDNQNIIHAQNLWDKFYFIDAFVGTPHNRFTKIVPALNKPEEKNRVLLSLNDFMNLVSNPQFNDNFSEKVISDSTLWYIEQNGAAEFAFRKNGWLADPQNKNGVIRSQEIALNLKLQITIPNGQ